jgi:predicted RNA-binding Zn-ribbon protein involved in translation (DUF1610 family)
MLLLEQHSPKQLKMNYILKQAREVYKNREEEYYLETIRKTADELERLQQKETPMKVVEIEPYHFNCPVCNETIRIDITRVYGRTFYKYCKNCGQHLDWSEKND